MTILRPTTAFFSILVFASCATTPEKAVPEKESSATPAKTDSYRVRCFEAPGEKSTKSMCVLQVGDYITSAMHTIAPTCFVKDEMVALDDRTWPEKYTQGRGMVTTVTVETEPTASCAAGKALPPLVRCFKRKDAAAKDCFIGNSDFVAFPVAGTVLPVCARATLDTQPEIHQLRDFRKSRNIEVKQEEVDALKSDTTWEDIKREEISATEGDPDLAPRTEDIQRLKTELAEMTARREALTLERLREERRKTIAMIDSDIATLERELENGPSHGQEDCDASSSYFRCTDMFKNPDNKGPRYSLGGRHFYLHDEFAPAWTEAEYRSQFHSKVKEMASWPARYECAAGKPLPSGTIVLPSG